MQQFACNTKVKRIALESILLDTFMSFDFFSNSNRMALLKDFIIAF